MQAPAPTAAKAGKGGYALAIHPDAEPEWAQLDEAAKKRFKQKLSRERLAAPRVVKDSVPAGENLYKLKIRNPISRLTYHVDDAARVLTLIAVSCRDDENALIGILN